MQGVFAFWCFVEITLFSRPPGRGQNRLKAVLDSELFTGIDQWGEHLATVQPQRAPTLFGDPSGKNLWGILLSTGGSLKATRGPFCAAAAEYSVTCKCFAEINAAWVRGDSRAQGQKVGRFRTCPYSTSGEKIYRSNLLAFDSKTTTIDDTCDSLYWR